MTDLIARLEAAEIGSRELDAAIYDAIDSPAIKIKTTLDYDFPAYTTSLDAALTLVPEGLAWGVADRKDKSKPLAICGHADNPMTETYAATPALALCIAALKARVAQGKDDG